MDNAGSFQWNVFIDCLLPLCTILAVFDNYQVTCRIMSQLVSGPALSQSTSYIVVTQSVLVLNCLCRCACAGLGWGGVGQTHVNVLHPLLLWVCRVASYVCSSRW